MNASSDMRSDPQSLADDAARAVLRTQWEGEPVVVLDAPPGAGKTGLTERLAVQSLGLLRERCMVATQTNEQAFDLARRLAEGFPRSDFWLFARRGLTLPPAVERMAGRNLHVVQDDIALPTGPCVVIANAAKWSWVKNPLTAFDLLVVDEAYQLPEYRFHQIAGLARRVVLVGDPGQIAPVITCEIERWRGDPAGPHVPCPRALLSRHSGVRRLALPISRRLNPDTVGVVQPAFYPDLPFRALAAARERGISLATAGTTDLDRALDLAASGASMIWGELPALVTGEQDDELAETIVAMLNRLFNRGARVRLRGEQHPLEARMVGVVCAHVSQVNAVQERLPVHLRDVFVETSDRFQGLERSIIFVHHPLSGRTDVSEFHLDAGRLCVMSSRHTINCFLLCREGLEDLLGRYGPVGDRVLGLDQDPEFEGWSAHMRFIRALKHLGRIVPVARSQASPVSGEWYLVSPRA